MSDIASLLSNSAQTNADFDFGKINQSYWQGLDQSFKNKQRDAFKDGVPTDSAGNVDVQSVMKTLFKNGDVNGAIGLIGASAGSQDRALLAGIDGPQRPAAQAPLVSPPSANRSAAVSVAPPLEKKGGPAPQQGPSATGPNSIVGIVGKDVPDELAGPIIQQVSAMAKLDPNAPINDPATMARVTEVTQAAIARQRGSQPPPQAMAQAPAPTAPQDDQLLKKLTLLSASPDKATAAAAKVRLEAYLKSKELTTEQKNAAASGMPMKDYLDRSETATTERDILTKQIMPRLDKSQELASAARDEITALHQARAQLDSPGGIVAGKFANEKLMMQKVGGFFGLSDNQVANTETFQAAIGSRILALVKGLGAGAGISNADRDFAAAMAGGNIKLDEKSIRRILDIGETAARARIAQHGNTVDKAMKSTEALRPHRANYLVEAPGAYKKPDVMPKLEPGKTIHDGFLFKGGNPREKANWVPVT